jgi:phosphoribosyl 1,2-cyclic phosphate phosphodiesterase
MARTVLTILGCGSSGGVPRVGGKWGECDPANPRNTRRRCSVLVQRFDGDGVTSVLIDTSPDLRTQLLDADVGLLDAVLYTHEHADHTHGLDDLRMVVMNRQERLPVYADQRTYNALISRFGYAFIQPEDSAYPPILNIHLLDGPVTISGEGGPLTLTPFPVEHGNIEALGFRVGNVAYTPDISDILEESRPMLQGLDCWIVDALRRKPHPSHSHLANTLSWINQLEPSQAVLTNMHIDLDYQTVLEETPDNVLPAYDGMTIVVSD